MRDHGAFEKHLCALNNGELIWRLCFERVGVFFFRSFLAVDDQMTGQYSRCDKTKAWITWFRVLDVTYPEHFLVTAMLLPILVTMLSMCSVHVSLASNTMPSILIFLTCSTGFPSSDKLSSGLLGQHMSWSKHHTFCFRNIQH